MIISIWKLNITWTSYQIIKIIGKKSLATSENLGVFVQDKLFANTCDTYTNILLSKNLILLLNISKKEVWRTASFNFLWFDLYLYIFQQKWSNQISKHS